MCAGSIGVLYRTGEFETIADRRMTMKKEEYVLLYEKCTAGKCTPEEREILEEYADEFLLVDNPWKEEELGNKEKVVDRMYRRLRAGIRKRERVKRLHMYLYPAAAAIGLLILGTVLFYFGAFDRPATPVAGNYSVNDIKPGRSQAILKLGDGTQITLDSSGTGILAREGDAVISKTDQGHLVYNLSGDGPEGLEVTYNTINTPRGGEFQLSLPDGTKVWLNALSSLRFPAVFRGKERRVELVGEAYFEVAENKDRPFKVLAGKTEVEVLGTHFNVNAYSGNQEIKTTLLEGAVRLRGAGSGAEEKEVLLKPGQQGTLTEQGAFEVASVNVEDAVAWKNGYFVFRDENIRSIMEKAARWYDVEVEYRGNMEGKNFWGKVSRFDNISELLMNMELTGMVHFEIEGRRVIVMP